MKTPSEPEFAEYYGTAVNALSNACNSRKTDNDGAK
jgi:hypothetical protein